MPELVAYTVRAAAAVLAVLVFIGLPWAPRGAPRAAATVLALTLLATALGFAQ